MKIKSALVLAVVATSCLVARAQNTNAPAGATGAAPGGAAVPPCGSEVMPLIVINDAPLTDAIQNLARQACLNIQIDPKAPVSQTDPKSNAQIPITVNFHWENVTALQALQALLDVNGLQLVQDPKYKIATVKAKDPTAQEPLISRVVSLKYSHPTNMVPMVKAVAGPRSQVLADVRTGQLVVLATEKDMLSVEDLIARLDTSPTQILIEARFMETTKNPRSAKGIDWSGTFAANNVSFGNNSIDALPAVQGTPPKIERITVPGGGTAVVTTPGTPPIPPLESGVLDRPQVIMSTAGGFGPIGFLNSDGLNAVVSFLNTDNATETISTPRTVALEGVPTTISVVQNVPVFEEQQGNNTGGTVQPNTVKPNYNLDVGGTILNEVGTKLIVTPRVYGASNVFLDLKPELSEVGPDARATLGGRVNTAPTFIRKKLQTQAMVPSGNTLVLGGLQEDRSAKNNTKVPILGDIPGLGRAFRSDVKEKNKRQLLIFVTPTILSAQDYIPNPEASEFLQQMPVEKPETPWGPWDSTEPKDWTQPVQ